VISSAAIGDPFPPRVRRWAALSPHGSAQVNEVQVRGTRPID
jgi:hypothetical protein